MSSFCCCSSREDPSRGALYNMLSAGTILTSMSIYAGIMRLVSLNMIVVGLFAIYRLGTSVALTRCAEQKNVVYLTYCIWAGVGHVAMEIALVVFLNVVYMMQPLSLGYGPYQTVTLEPIVYPLAAIALLGIGALDCIIQIVNLVSLRAYRDDYLEKRQSLCSPLANLLPPEPKDEAQKHDLPNDPPSYGFSTSQHTVYQRGLDP